jgi:hypothetical protein
MQEMIKNKFRDIIQNINKGVPEKVRRSSELLVALMVYDSLDVITPEERCEYMTVFYKLLLHVHTRNPRMAYHMVSGVLLFGQSEEGLHYQPFLDHLMIELFDSYITSSGWQILKPFTNTLRNSIRSIENEQIFTHIIKRVVAQLRHDETHIDESSDICYNLPREKSFNWGWFSYYVGVALADKQAQAHAQAECRGRQQQTKKMLRACMMSYRILITLLRNVQREYFTREEQDDIEYEHVSSRPITPCPGPSITPEEAEEDEDMDETWAGILHMIQSDKYKWTENVIRVSLYWSPLPASVSQLPPNTFAAVVDVDVPITEAEVPTNTTEVHDNVMETYEITSTTPEAEVEIKSEVVATTTRSWFSWFGL